MKKSLILSLVVLLSTSLFAVVWATGPEKKTEKPAVVSTETKSDQVAKEAPKMIEETAAKSNADRFLKSYLADYAVQSIAKDEAKGSYLVMVKASNNAELQLVMNGADGKVTNIMIPTPK